MTKPMENLSRYQRQNTPLFFAKCLLGLVRGVFGPVRISILFCSKKSLYWKLHFAHDIDIVGPSRDATKYEGPHPVIAHPPCGPWGKYKSNCFHDRQAGIEAMRIVHQFGGLVEHPVGSSLFAEHGRHEAIIMRVNQGNFGHMSIKPTLIYLWPTLPAKAGQLADSAGGE